MADLRAPTSLLIGLIGDLDEAARGRVQALAEDVQRKAVESWPDLLRLAGPIRFKSIHPGALAGSCDFLAASALQDGLEEFHEPGQLIVRVAAEGSNEPSAAIVAFERDAFDRPRLVDRNSPDPVEALARHVFRPPAGARGVERLRDFIQEELPVAPHRLEYNILLRLLGPKEKAASSAAPDSWSSAQSLAPDATARHALDDLRAIYERADMQAVRYGDSWRSVVVARSTLLLAPTIVSGAIGILAPQLSSYTSFLQILILMRIYWDRRAATRGRWRDKWFDYRDLAERLRCLRYLMLCADAPLRRERAFGALWTAWYAERIARSVMSEPPQEDRIEERSLHLVDAEIRPQMVYHRSVVRRFCALDLRLRAIARGILIVSVTLGVALLGAGLFRHGLGGVPWPALTSLGLSVAPALVANLNGFRGEFDMVRQGERSAKATSGLARIIRELDLERPTQAVLRRAAERAAQIMIGDTIEWRSTFELRAARLSRR